MVMLRPKGLAKKISEKILLEKGAATVPQSKPKTKGKKNERKKESPQENGSKPSQRGY